MDSTSPSAQEEGPAPESRTVSREKVLLGIPSRAAMAPPGGSVSGRGLLLRLADLGGSLVVYLALMAAGIGIFLFGVSGPRIRVIVASCGAVFFLLVLRALQVELYRRRERPRGSREKGSKKEPWTWDHPWSTSWMQPEGRHLHNSLLGAVTFFAFVAVCNFLWLSGETFFYIFVTLLDLLALYVLYRILRKGFLSLRYRTPVVIWEEIPVYPGNLLQGRIAFPRDMRAMGPTRLTLRCLVESWADDQLQTDVHAIYRETREVPLPGEPGEPLDVLSFSFKVPRDLPGTSLTKREPIYWHLVVNVPVAGPDLEVAFLAPIYQRRG
jgi:hypothetical protein